MDKETNSPIPDALIPGMSSGSEGHGFTSGTFEIPPYPRSFPWKWVAIIGGAVLLIVFIILGSVFLIPKLLDTPERTVRAYYGALQANDSDLMRKYLDPDDPIASNSMPLVGQVTDSIENYIKQYGLDINIKWEFQDLVFNTLEQ